LEILNDWELGRKGGGVHHAKWRRTQNLTRSVWRKLLTVIEEIAIRKVVGLIKTAEIRN
jgi:hypothetical protein